MVKLKDICTVNPKGTILADKQLVSFVPMPKVGENGEFDSSDVKEYQEVKKGFTNFQDGDVLFAKITPCMENGKGAIARSLKNGYGFGSTEFHVLRPNTELISSEWLYYLTSWTLFRKDAANNMTGSAGQKRVPKSFLENYEINLPDLETQKKQTTLLDHVGNMIALRKQQLAKLDELVKARFVELFGACKSTMAVNDVCLIITDGTHQPPKFQHKGIPFILVSNIAGNKVTYETEKFISEETYAELVKRTPIEIGDVLLSTVGSYGHPAVVLEEKKFLFQRHIAYLKPDRNLINSQYLHSALLAPDTQRQIEEKVKGIAQKTLNLSEIRKIIIPVPGMDLQNEFAGFVKQVDKSKLTIQQSLDKLEVLKKTLMKKFFDR